ncbi:hypothetical protein D3C78_1153520 [compost metagenome]
MSTHPLVTIVQLQIKESENIFMEYVEIYGDSAFTCTELVHADRCVVQLANPRDNTGAGVFMTTNV